MTGLVPEPPPPPKPDMPGKPENPPKERPAGAPPGVANKTGVDTAGPGKGNAPSNGKKAIASKGMSNFA
ncbi:hypothetical protein [Paracoccus sediminilitoris]|uniref:hypothetical protein n=1 Tax=Paracoccus sediminilitoris TaxID=2202419 RepID=UPI0011B93D8A|nr:hypothetical protein [Paracoccus sediminilitoris]